MIGTLVACIINVLITGLLFRWTKTEMLLGMIFVAIVLGQREGK